MRALRPQLAVGAGVLATFLMIAPSMQAQAAATISGTVTDASGTALPNASVSIKNLASGQTTTAMTDVSGSYKAENLSPGDYEVSVSAGTLGPKTSKVTLAEGAQQKVDISLGPAQPTAPGQNLPNAPSSTQSEPSLSDLGFPAAQTQGSVQEQALLDKRTHMLKMHQRLGLITTGPLVATVIAGSFAGGKSTSSSTRDLHAALGSATAGLYFTSAYFAIFAPKPHGTETRGPIKVHKALALIHGPGMILTPILGAIAFEQKSRGEKVHGIASAHGPVAYVTAGAYGAALLSVSLKF